MPKTPANQSESRALTIRDRLKTPAMMEELGKAMPAHCKPERMARVALTAITRTPDLANCDQASFFTCLLNLSQWGLEPDGRRAHLIPFKNRKRGVTECQLIIDYKGLVELAYRSGAVRSIHADVVREGDLFSYNLGRVVQHTPHFLRRDEGKPDKPGKVIAAYCHCVLNGGTVKDEVMSFDEIKAVQNRSMAGKSGPWQTDWNEMAKKTVFRRASKWLPLSAELRDAIESDDDLHAPAPQEERPPVKSLDDLSSVLDGKQEPAEQDETDGPDWKALESCTTPDEVEAWLEEAHRIGTQDQREIASIEAGTKLQELQKKEKE